MARTGERDEFVARTEGLRRQLFAHCYRMTGSLDDAEDIVQETYLRAWRAFAEFESRSSVRTWLFRIATNVCLTFLQHRSRRVLPAGLGAPGDDVAAPLVFADANVSWIQPVPDALTDPAAIVARRDSTRLALIASLQYLSARQRVVLLLRDVLGWSAAEVAEALETTTDAVKSTLKRARARIEEYSPVPDEVPEIAEPARKALLGQYISAFENADAEKLRTVLRDDAVLEFPPARTWFAGKRYCVPFLAGQVFGEPGRWRMLPTSANGGQPAAVSYVRDEDGGYRAYGAAVLTVAAEGIARITAFGDPSLVRWFGAPDRLPRPAR
ncbi:RNA polymerase subunit sigma-70 [Amycolatopsis benzoatilytica]|uniref:RNA polymerase subunit sigma-70 n=1 Tax=Amycolatopsis benzoatilytica TaxID=346045 RepID=UPI000360A096|nr:RNA polymerase subunit sigma-70 [Amycolatopsis benzoatilytica]